MFIDNFLFIRGAKKRWTIKFRTNFSVQDWTPAPLFQLKTLRGRVWMSESEDSLFRIQWFPTYCGSRHPYFVLKISGGTPSWFIRYKDQGIIIIGGTPGTSSWHPSVPRHPGWEPLNYMNGLTRVCVCMCVCVCACKRRVGCVPLRWNRENLRSLLRKMLQKKWINFVRFLSLASFNNKNHSRPFPVKC